MSFGTHTGGLGAMVNPTTRKAQIDIAHTLGHTMIGTAGDPVGGAGANLLANWEVAANNYNLVGAALAEEGLRYYLHAEQNNFNFFNDPRAPRASPGSHRLDWFAANTDPTLVLFEPDILHSYAGRARFPDPVDGSLWARRWTTGRRTPADPRLARQGRQPARAAAGPRREPVHADARSGRRRSRTRSCPARARSARATRSIPTPPSSATSASSTRSARRARDFCDRRDRQRPGPGGDPGRSLRHAKYSLQNMLGLRGGVKAQGKSTVADEATYESDSVEAAG